MANEKRKEQRKIRDIVRLFLIGMMLMLCCGCSTGRAENEKKSEENHSEENRSEENTQEERTTAENEFRLEDYASDASKTTYRLMDFMPKDADIVLAGFYDENTILLLDEKIQSNQLVHTISTLSLETGERNTRFENKNQVPEGHFCSTYGYVAISYNPFIIYNCNTCTLEIYNDGLDAAAYVSFGGGVNFGSIQYSRTDDAIYFMTDYNQRIYKLNLAALDYGIDDSLVAPQIINAEEMCEWIWKPDVNMGSCILSGIDETGNILKIRAIDLTTNTWINLLYNVNTGEYEKIFADEMEFFYELQALDNSWALMKLDNNEETEYRGYEFLYYDKGIKYLFHPDLSAYEAGVNQEAAYTSYCELKFDIGSRGRDGWLLSGVVDCNEGKFKDILLWNYGNATSETIEAADGIREVALYQEIDYGALTDKADLLEEKYGIQIIMGANVKDQFPDYHAEVAEDEALINNALDRIDEALSIYPDGFIEELQQKWITSINFYLAGTLTSEDSGIYTENAGGFTSGTAGYQMIVVNINTASTETILHEMSHVIDNKLSAMGVLYELEEQWAKCNPEGFDYDYNYMEYEGDIEYTGSSGEYWSSMNYDTVYFYYEYAKTYPTEDRATLIENFYSWERIPYCYNSVHIQEKLGVYLECLVENFESCKKDDSFLWNVLYDRLISEGIENY